MLFGSRSRPLIGLDITTSSIKLIELTQSGRSFRAESYAAEPTPPNSINEKTQASYAIGDGALFIRGEKSLFRIQAN